MHSIAIRVKQKILSNKNIENEYPEVEANKYRAPFANAILRVFKVPFNPTSRVSKKIKSSKESSPK